MSEYITTIQELIVSYGLSILFAIVIFLIGRWLAGIAARLVEKAMGRSNVNETLTRFAGSLTYVGVLVVAAVAALDQLGIQTASLVAILGAATLAIGFALQGSLANFAAGTLILFFKPFSVGDLIEVSDTFGAVEEIQIFNTVILTPENKTVIIPNAQVTAGNITNYSKKGFLRLDMVFGIGYNDNLLKAKQILEELINADERVMKDPAPTVAVLELGDSSVNFAVRPHVKVEDYWDVHFNITEQVKLRFDQEGISIPYPQQDVHVLQLPSQV